MNTKIVTTTATVTTKDAYYNGAVIFDAAADGNIKVYKGQAATAANLIDVLGASDEKQTDRSWWGERGIRCPSGIHVVKTNCDNVVVMWTTG